MIRIATLSLILAGASFAAESSLLSLVPAEATVIGGIHVDQTVSSPFGQYILSRVGSGDRDFADFISSTGFDPRRDLREVVFASISATNNAGLIVARGVFNGPQLLTTIQAKGHGTITKYGGIDVLETPGKRTSSLAFVEGSLAVAGDPALVRAALDRRSGQTTLSGLAAKANELSAASHAWMVSNGVLKAPLQSGTRNQGPVALGAVALQGIMQSSAGLTFGSLVRFNGEAVTRSEKDALALVDVVRFLASMVQMNGSANPDLQKLQPVLDTLDVKAVSNLVKLSLQIPQVDLERLMNVRKPMRSASVGKEEQSQIF